MAEDEALYAAAERRIEYFSAGIAALGALIATIHWGARTAASFTVGGFLSWINFRWLKQGVAALTRLSVTQERAEKPRVPASVYVKFLGRYALLLLAAYVILRGFRLPLGSFLLGLFVIVAAVLVEMIGQLFRSGPPQGADS
jgi:ATP synthase I subunit